MIDLTLYEVLNSLKGRIYPKIPKENIIISSVTTDNRIIGKNALFIALVGETHDGHDFAKEAVLNGAKVIVTDRELDIDVIQIIVHDTRLALGALGAYVYEKISPTTVAITGSNGKTSVKEMIASILSEKGETLATKGNFNNDIGLPLTLLNLTKDDKYAVLEMGANHPKEIEYLTSLVKPNVSIVTNIGKAHLEGFKTLEGVALAKSEIFSNLTDNGVAIINQDDPFLSLQKSLFDESNKLAQHYLTFGLSHEANFQAINLIEDDLGYYRYDLIYGKNKDKKVNVNLKLAGLHQVYNSLSAIAASYTLGISIDEILDGLNKLTPVKGRMTPNKVGRFLIVDDTYNANPSSVEAAINWLKKRKTYKVILLGDIGELGEETLDLHKDIGLYAKESGINCLYAMGILTEETTKVFGVHAKNIAELKLLLLKDLNSIGDEITILVKGSRSSKMEGVVKMLEDIINKGELK